MNELQQWVVWLPVWIVFSVAIHEAGHAVAARLVGLRVAFCGVGIQKPLVSFSIGQTRCFFGLWPINGMTLICRDSPELPLRPMIFAVAAGPLTNFLVGLISLSIDLALTGPQPALSILTTLSFLLTLNLLPIRSRGTGFNFRTDGMMILQMLRRHRREGISIGVKLRNHDYLFELGKQVRSPLAQNSHELAIALELIQSFGAGDLAAERLNRAIERQKNTPPSQQLPDLTRMVQERLGQIEIENPADVGWVANDARQFVLLMRADRLAELERKPEALELLKIVATDPRYAEAARIRQIEFESRRITDEDLRQTIEPIHRIRLLSRACSQTKANSPEFPRLSGELRNVLADESERIDDPQLRERFLKFWLEPVAESALEESKLWPVFAPEPEAEIERRWNWPGWIGFAAWILTLILGMEIAGDDWSREQVLVLILMIAGLGLFFGALGLARPGPQDRKIAFISSLGNGLQVVSRGLQLLGVSLPI